jgi:hypothetical protein
MFFKGVEVEPGDFVIFTTPVIPLPEVSAAVVGVTGGVLEVRCIRFELFQHDGRFTEAEVEQFVVAQKAKEFIFA